MRNFYCPHAKAWTWAAQWMEGASRPATFSFLGSHYRGWPLVKVCDACKRRLQNGQPITVYRSHAQTEHATPIRKGEPYCLVPRGEPPLARPIADEVTA